jgi:hypothetical protein
VEKTLQVTLPEKFIVKAFWGDNKVNHKHLLGDNKVNHKRPNLQLLRHLVVACTEYTEMMVAGTCEQHLLRGLTTAMT